MDSALMKQRQRRRGTFMTPTRPAAGAGLQSLAELKARLAEAERAQAAARAQAAQEERERRRFALFVGPVQPLRRGHQQHRATLHDRPRPQPRPLQREKDEAAALVQALSDEMDVEALLETDEALSFRRPDVGPDVLRRLRRGVWSIQAQLDLHGLRRDEAREALNRFFKAAVQQRLRCVRVVHGKGHGSPGRTPVLKDKVKRWLVQKEEVIAFVQARATEGGHGALVVLLKA